MKEKSISKLKKELDSAFSKFIRARDNYICYTCNKKLEPKFSQCGHFVSRLYNGTRWDEQNCRCQCYSCNINLSGNLAVFKERLIAEYGSEIISILNVRKRAITKFSTEWYQEKIAFYKTSLLDITFN